jgi:hypothetical protein
MNKALPSKSESDAYLNKEIARLKAHKDYDAYILGCTLEALLRQIERINDLRFDVRQLQDTQLKYQGIFSKDQQYNPHDLCTHRGGLWHCQESTRSAPGTSKAWRLTSKTPVSGRGEK